MRKNLFGANFILILLVFIYVSCSNTRDATEKLQFITNNNTSILLSDSLDYFYDNTSIAYLNELEEAINSRLYANYEHIGEIYKMPITSVVVGELLTRNIKDADTTINIDKSDILLMLKLLNYGMFRYSKSNPVVINDLKKTSSSQVEIQTLLKIPESNNVNIGVNYILNLEDDLWKINIPSTFTFDEKYLGKLHRRSNINLREFVNSYINGNVDRSVMMRYRIN